MVENEPSEPAAICYPVITSNITLLPGEKTQIVIEGDEEALKKELSASGYKAFAVKAPSKRNDSTLSHIGTIAVVQELKSRDDGSICIALEGQSRGLPTAYKSREPILIAEVKAAEISVKVDISAAEELLEIFNIYLNSPRTKAGKKLSAELSRTLKADPAALADKIALHLEPGRKNMLLQELNPNERTEMVYNAILEEKTMKANPPQKDALMAKELGIANTPIVLDPGESPGESDNDEDDFEDFTDPQDLAKRIVNAGMTKQGQKKCEKELNKLATMALNDPNASKVREYLDEMLSLPWKKSSELVRDLGLAKEVLDADHYGLEKVKERIIEQLAVQLHRGKVNGSIICLAGPPGVGKTSIGKSIAKAAGRKFVRVSLGGVSDEAVIRGHSITYMGSIPGKITRAMQEAGTINPVIQLDEIDKMAQGVSVRGDPTAALLEVLDPAQNNTFVDHYTGIKYDLSNVMFIATANDVDNIPGPLYDRMEVIHIEGYTDDEKMEIAKRYLVKKEMEKSGLTEAQFSINDQALAKLVDGYTWEAGVRGLEHEIGNLARKTVRQLEQGTVTSVNITPENLEAYAGPVKISHEMVDPTPRVGHMNGLAVAGGTTGVILTVQAISYADSKGGIEATGNLSETMGEAIKNADAFVKANAAELGINKKEYLNNTIHIKIGRGGVNSDGPSAGLAIGAVITSVRTGIPIRGDIAMTGEINLLGEAWAIGGLAKKFDGAFKSGIKTVLFPAANMKDLENADFPQALKDKLEIMPDARAEDLAEVPEGKMRVIPVANEMEVLRHALVRMPTPLAKEPAQAPLTMGNLTGDQLASLLTLANVFNGLQANAPANANVSTPRAQRNRVPVAAARRSFKKKPGTSL